MAYPADTDSRRASVAAAPGPPPRTSNDGR